MRSNKKTYLKIYQKPSQGRNEYSIEIGNEFEAYEIQVNFCDLISIKNEIKVIEDRDRNNEIERN